MISPQAHAAAIQAVGSFSGAVLALIGVLIGASISAVIALKTNRRTIFIDAVTKERAGWRADIRLATAQLVQQTAIWLGTPLEKPEGLDAARTAIRLRLNPLGGDENKLDTHLLAALATHERLMVPAHRHNPEPLREALEDIQTGIQLLLKQEWEKSKEEATHFRIIHDKQAGVRGKAILKTAVDSFVQKVCSQDERPRPH